MSDRGVYDTDEFELFDLPLEPPDAEPSEESPRTQQVTPAAGAATLAARPQQLESELLEAARESPELEPAQETQQSIALEEVEAFPDEPTSSAEPKAPPEPTIAPFGARFLSGGADVLIHCGALAAAALGLRLMSIEPRFDQWPGLFLFLGAFSFLYTVISLAFWGQTAGMAWFGLAARESTQFPLSFRQACLRWLGGWITVALAGLPMLLLVRGASLNDRLSRSHTYRSVLSVP